MKTGTRLALDTIFNAKYKAVLLDSVNARRVKAIRKEIASILDTIEARRHRQNRKDSLMYADMLELFEGCLTRELLTDFDFMKFYLTLDELYIELDRYSAHVNRNLDELGPFVFIFRVSEWKKYLSNYGLELIR